MYSLDEVKKLIKVLEDSKLSVLELSSKDGESIYLEKSVQQISVATSTAPLVQTQNAVMPNVNVDVDDNLTAIKSPMVGVFYSASSPDSKPFVSVGQQVQKGDTVCIIEAMKLMNEITAEQSGVISEVCVNDGDIIEYGQTLFR